MAVTEQAKNLVKGLPTPLLMEVWENTTNNNDECIPMVRGWIMDEIEDRYPKAFSAWIESDTCRDGELKDYIRRLQA